MTSRLASVLAATRPIRRGRSRRLPLLAWPAMDPEVASEAEARDAIRELADRGIALASTWNPDRRDESLARGLLAARIQRDLGLAVCVNATPAFAGFCNGEESTAHVDGRGERFFDFSFDGKTPIGCPFSLAHRCRPVRERVEGFAEAYARQRLPVDLAFADWEIDGPIEWNGAWEASRRCVRCRERIPDLGSFASFQEALRRIRSEMQRAAFTEVMTSRFPGVLVGNYGVYPHDGWRYWYDWYERFVEGAPHRLDGRARHRAWFPEFPLTGYTMAMPVVYPWKPSYRWHDHPDADFRWFRAMLLAGSNAPRSSPPSLPIVPFVHWRPIDVPGGDDAGGYDVVPMSRRAYTELLWHLLLRGCDTFFLWCAAADAAEEIAPVHEVYAASYEFSAFIESGAPLRFDVPDGPGPVVSALRRGDRLLVRRTDFASEGEPAHMEVDGRVLDIPPTPGSCRIIALP